MILNEKNGINFCTFDLFSYSSILWRMFWKKYIYLVQKKNLFKSCISDRIKLLVIACVRSNECLKLSIILRVISLVDSFMNKISILIFLDRNVLYVVYMTGQAYKRMFINQNYLVPTFVIIIQFLQLHKPQVMVQNLWFVVYVYIYTGAWNEFQMSGKMQ